MKLCAAVPQVLGLAVLMVAAPGRAAAQDRKPDWVLSMGGVVTGAVPSFSDGWALDVAEGFDSAHYEASSDYSPGTSTGLQGMAQVWLPSGFGLFAELQQDAQKVPSRQEAEAAFTLVTCQRCPPFTFNLTGSADDETFQRDETRVHLGVGYRFKVASNLYLEATGGVTRFSLDQTLVRQVEQDPDAPCVVTGLISQTCTVSLRVTEKEAQSGNAWGFNAGAAVTFFFSRYVGVGAGVRYSRGGVVELEGMDAYHEDGEEFRTRVEARPGGVTGNLAVRVRF